MFYVFYSEVSMIHPSRMILLFESFSETLCNSCLQREEACSLGLILSDTASFNIRIFAYLKLALYVSLFKSLHIR